MLSMHSSDIIKLSTKEVSNGSNGTFLVQYQLCLLLGLLPVYFFMDVINRCAVIVYSLS